MVAATSALTEFSSLTSVTALATEFDPYLAAISPATSVPSAMSAIMTRAPSAASACE